MVGVSSSPSAYVISYSAKRRLGGQRQLQLADPYKPYAVDSCSEVFCGSLLELAPGIKLSIGHGHYCLSVAESRPRDTAFEESRLGRSEARLHQDYESHNPRKAAE